MPDSAGLFLAAPDLFVTSNRTLVVSYAVTLTVSRGSQVLTDDFVSADEWGGGPHGDGARVASLLPLADRDDDAEYDVDGEELSEGAIDLGDGGAAPSAWPHPVGTLGFPASGGGDGNFDENTLLTRVIL